jgi:hypothetical protein
MAHLISANPSEKNGVEIFFPGDRFPIIVGPSLRTSGWQAGRWVMYVTGAYDWTVEVSDGTMAAGFILFPSSNYGISWRDGGFAGGPNVGSNANFTSIQPAKGQGGQNVVTMINGGTRALFQHFETQSIVATARTGPDILYGLNDDLKISENGLLCNDSDGDLATVGITTPIVVGIVSAIPSTSTGNRLGIDLKY